MSDYIDVIKILLTYVASIMLLPLREGSCKDVVEVITFTYISEERNYPVLELERKFEFFF